jgi:hypothetical protein
MRRRISVTLVIGVPLLALGTQPASACWGGAVAATGIGPNDRPTDTLSRVEPATLMPVGVAGAGVWVIP